MELEVLSAVFSVVIMMLAAVVVRLNDAKYAKLGLVLDFVIVPMVICKLAIDMISGNLIGSVLSLVIYLCVGIDIARHVNLLTKE